MAKTAANGSKNLIIVIVLIVAAAAGYGYFNQAEELREGDNSASSTANAAEATQPPAKPEVVLPPADHPIFSARENDIVVGKPEAATTIIEYASLSCPHCAHFQEKILPALKKEYIETGKVKLVFRHFPLNEPAMRGAQVVECLGGDQRKVAVNTLFATQKDWAFHEKFFESLKKFAELNGMDAASFASCMNDKTIEQRILGYRAEAAKTLGVEHTPALFINGVPYKGELAIEGVREALGK